MKRVKVMLSAILVMAIVAGALAFKAKSPGVCAYTKSITNGPATTTCDRVTTLLVTSETVDGSASQYATILAADPGTIKCPATTAECSNEFTLAAED